SSPCSCSSWSRWSWVPTRGTNEGVTRMAYTRGLVIGTMLRDADQYPDAMNTGYELSKSIRAHAPCSVATLEMLYRMDEYEQQGYLPVEALNMALREEQ